MKQLNEHGLELQADFLAEYSDYGCTCFISAPCGYCIHPGNPLNLLEQPDAWEPDDAT